jgi:hypothetical protein
MKGNVMSESASMMARQPFLQVALAFLGTVVYCIYGRSWKDAAHLVYDIPANLAVFAFIAQLLIESGRSRPDWCCGARLLLVAGMTAVCVGRQYFDWNISGHLSCVLAVAIVQTADPRLMTAERLLYWIPLLIVLIIRWWLFDKGQHWQTYNAIMFAVLSAGLIVAFARPSMPN